MMRNLISKSILMTCLIIGLGSSLSYSDDHDKAKALLIDGKILPLEVLLAKVKQDMPGKVIEVELEYEYGQYVYELELLKPTGKIIELYYDARTGRRISVEAED